MRIFGILALGAVGIAILLSLGIWQVQRLAWKQEILAEIDAKIVQAPVAIPENANAVDHGLMPVTAKGRITAAPIRVLVSQKIYGAGYRLIARFETQTGRDILLDIGFISSLVTMPVLNDGPMEITGNLHWPDEIDGFTPENDLNANIWFARDVPTLAAHFGTEPVLVILRTSQPAQPVVTPLPINSANIPNDHLNYAITWFSLALIWLGMTGYMLYRSRDSHDEN